MTPVEKDRDAQLQLVHDLRNSLSVLVASMRIVERQTRGQTDLNEMANAALLAANELERLIAKVECSDN